MRADQAAGYDMSTETPPPVRTDTLAVVSCGRFLPLLLCATFNHGPAFYRKTSGRVKASWPWERERKREKGDQLGRGVRSLLNVAYHFSPGVAVVHCSKARDGGAKAKRGQCYAVDDSKSKGKRTWRT